MNLQLLDFDCTEDAEGVVCWDALAQPAHSYSQALLQEVAQVLQWAHGFDEQGPGPLENGAQWDFDLQVTLLGDDRKPLVAMPRFVPSTGQLSLRPEPLAQQSLSLSLTLSGTPAFVQAFRDQYGLT
jgi:hypothetical protein